MAGAVNLMEGETVVNLMEGETVYFSGCSVEWAGSDLSDFLGKPQKLAIL